MQGPCLVFSRHCNAMWGVAPAHDRDMDVGIRVSLTVAVSVVP